MELIARLRCTKSGFCCRIDWETAGTVSSFNSGGGAKAVNFKWSKTLWDTELPKDVGILRS
jgi:hypothetical protein